MTKWISFVVTALAFVAGLAITYYLLDAGGKPSVQGALGINESSALESALLASLAFVVTVVGVLIGSIYRRLLALQREGQRRAHLGAVFVDVARSIDLQLGLVGSPVVFGLLWQAIADISLPGMLIVALQNGFCCHAILQQTLVQPLSAPRLSS